MGSREVTHLLMIAQLRNGRAVLLNSNPGLPDSQSKLFLLEQELTNYSPPGKSGTPIYFHMACGLRKVFTLLNAWGESQRKIVFHDK